MQSTSATWKALWESGSALLETVAVINGTTYEISPPRVTRGLMPDGPSVGNVVSACCAFEIETGDSIPRSAEVRVKMRLWNGDGDDPLYSEWLPVGTFFISRRQRDPITGVLSLECYDALLKANAMLEALSQASGATDGEAENDLENDPGEATGGDSAAQASDAPEYPCPMADMLAHVAALLGVAADARTVIHTGAVYTIDRPSAAATLRDVLGEIAAAHGGSFVMTPDNRLRLVPLASAPGDLDDAVAVDAVVGGLYAGASIAVTGVRYTAGEALPVLIGSGDGLVLDVRLSMGAAQALYEQVVGTVYRPYALQGAIYDPSVELGDYVRYDTEIASVLCVESATLGAGVTGDISAPDPAELADEFPYIGANRQTLNEAKAYAVQTVAALDESLDQENIFNRLTDNGQEQGVLLYNGRIYINASYIQAGKIRADFVDFNSYDLGGILTPDEHDPSTLFPGQSVSDGWIVNTTSPYAGVTVMKIPDARPYRGQTIEVSGISHESISGGVMTYVDEAGMGTSIVWDLPTYGSIDSTGALTGPTKIGNDYKFNRRFVIPSDAVSYEVEMGTKVRDILAEVSLASSLEFRYANNVGISYKGLQVGKLVVNRTGKLTNSESSYFNGPVFIDAQTKVSNTTASTSKTTGALVVSGGVGIAGTVYANAFNGNLTGDVTGNCSGSAGSVAWGNVTGKPASYPGGCTGHAASDLALTGGTLTGRLTASGRMTVATNGGSWISQKDTNNLAIQFPANAVVDGSRYDGLLGGKSTDGSSWNMGIINNTIYFGRYTSGHTANSLQYAIQLPLDINFNVGNAITNISRSGTTFTATRANGGTFTFTQQDNDHYAWGDITGKPNVATTDTAQTFTGTKSWGTSGAGGQLNGAATNGGINSIRVGDDVWLGDCNAGGIMGMKSTGANCGFYMYNSSGTQIGQLYFNGTNLVCNKAISANLVGNVTGNCSGSSGSCTGNAANVTGTVAIGHGGTGATNASSARINLGFRAGTLTLNSVSTSVASQNISFSSALPNAPVAVVATLRTDNVTKLKTISIGVGNKSASGFTLYYTATQSITTATSVDWMAMA